MNQRPYDSYVWVVFLIISVLMYLNLYFHIHEHELRLDSYLEYCITREGEVVVDTTADNSITKLHSEKNSGAIFEPTTTLNITTHRVTTSPKSGRRFLAMVTSWTKSRSRRIKFYQAWHKAWPELTIVTEYSFLNHRRVRGYALLVSNVLGMHKALQFSKTHTNQDFDYFIILEDDAMPFPDTSWPTVMNSNKKDWNNDLDQMLDELEANNGGALFLGCHSVDSIDRQRLIENNGNIDGGASIAQLTFAFGSYAWMISRKHLPMLQQRFANVLQNKSSHTGTTDDDAHHFLQDQNIREYVAVPLLVDHHSDGESLTWENQMKYKWEGNRDWWNFKDFKNPKRTSRKGE